MKGLKMGRAVAKVQQMELSFGPYQFTRSGLVITGESSQTQWEQCGEGLKAVDQARQWAIGDWLRDGKRHYGDGLYKRASDVVGMQDENELARYKRLSELYAIEIRVHTLTFRHHYEVASIYPTITLPDGMLAIGDEPDMKKISEFLKDAEKNDLSVKALREKVREYKEKQRQHIQLANEPEKYDVIYADPPWQYTSGDQHGTEEQETVLADHYPSMTISDICALPVKNMAGTNAVLWLWCTSPTLVEALEVIDAWGFKYKASMVWDKVAHNVGNYVSVRHEFLLICTRGQTPKVPKLVDSVYSEERQEHSRKPDYFRDLIDELYPNGKRLEMFARRTDNPAWNYWGNEVAA